MTNTEVVLAMYEEFFNGHDVNAALKYVKEDYIQSKQYWNKILEIDPENETATKALGGIK